MTHTILVNEPTVNGQRHFGVEWADGTRTDYSVSTVAELKRVLTAESTRLDAAVELAKVPVDTPVDLTPDPVIPPTQFELDKAAYFKEVLILDQYRKLFAAGDKPLDDQEALVKSLFDPAYYGKA